MRDGSGTRRKIHQAALRLFVDKGVAEATVRDLAQAAGIAEGTLYRHYASKDALVVDLFATNYAAFARRLEAVHAPFPDFRAKLHAIVADLCRFFDDNPTLFRFLLLVQHQVLPRMADDGDNPVEVVQRTVAAAIARDEITVTDPALATAMVMGLVLQPAVAMVYGRLDPPFGRYAASIADACWRALHP